MKKKFLVFSLISAISTLAVGCSLFGVGVIDENTAAVYTDSNGLALRGYDAVAYFTEKKPTKGKAEFSTEWNGAKWHFSSAENKDAFIKEPAKYAPQYGGYCSYAVSQGYTASSDPEAWTVVDGKLYVNYSKSVKDTWDKDTKKYIIDANENWKKLEGKAEESRKDKK